MTILPQDEIEQIVTVCDFIIRFPSMSVGDIKRKFRLTSEEYEMIFDLCMPKIRAGSSSAYWRTKHHMLASRIKNVIDQSKPSKLKDDILAALKEPDNIDEALTEEPENAEE